MVALTIALLHCAGSGAASGRRKCSDIGRTQSLFAACTHACSRAAGRRLVPCARWSTLAGMRRVVTWGPEPTYGARLA